MSLQSKEEVQYYLESQGLLGEIPDWEKKWQDAKDAIEAQVGQGPERAAAMQLRRHSCRTSRELPRRCGCFGRAGAGRCASSASASGGLWATCCRGALATTTWWGWRPSST